MEEGRAETSSVPEAVESVNVSSQNKSSLLTPSPVAQGRSVEERESEMDANRDIETNWPQVYLMGCQHCRQPTESIFSYLRGLQ